MKFDYEWKLSDGYPAPGIDYHGSTVFSTFACGGGSTMGYKLAGYDVIGMNEIDPKMAKAYKKNHNPKYSYVEPIQEFKDRDDLPDELYNLDILDGSPPCSSFSMAGNRSKDWGKKKHFREGQAEQVLDTLFFDFIDLAKRLQPKIVVAENVNGLLQGDARQYLKKVYDELQDAGYYVQHFLLNAAEMGVPQKRERVFIIAFRKDLAEPFLVDFNMFEQVPKLHLEFDESEIPFGEIRDKDDNESNLSPLDGRLWEKREFGDTDLSYISLRERDILSRFNAKILYDNKVANTITGEDQCVLFQEKRTRNKKELINCGSFPADYNFLELNPSYLIGMSVPPVMMAQIAHEIYKQWISQL